MQEKTERNKIIWIKKKMGATHRALAAEYNVSFQAIVSICLREKRNEELEKVKKELKKLKREARRL
jgi:DNA-binding XRE family transcriptional regulator